MVVPRLNHPLGFSMTTWTDVSGKWETLVRYGIRKQLSTMGTACVIFVRYNYSYHRKFQMKFQHMW